MTMITISPNITEIMMMMTTSALAVVQKKLTLELLVMIKINVLERMYVMMAFAKEYQNVMDLLVMMEIYALTMMSVMMVIVKEPQ
jgi:ABC-type transport system involved in Fe-S cluster assembly fused permease/ATPase subunit